MNEAHYTQVPNPYFQPEKFRQEVVEERWTFAAGAGVSLTGFIGSNVTADLLTESAAGTATGYIVGTLIAAGALVGWWLKGRALAASLNANEEYIFVADRASSLVTEASRHLRRLDRERALELMPIWTTVLDLADQAGTGGQVAADEACHQIALRLVALARVVTEEERIQVLADEVAEKERVANLPQFVAPSSDDLDLARREAEALREGAFRYRAVLD